MNFLFDNNLSPHLAHGIARLTAHEERVGRVEHLRDRFGPSTPDIEWIEALAGMGGDWYIISVDKFRKSKGAEREALRRAGFTVYVLDAQWAKQPFWKVAAQLVTWWPNILQHARLTQGGVYRVQWRASQGHKLTAY